MGLRGLENSVTRFHDVLVPGRERDRRRGPGPQDRADHAEHRPAVAAGDVRRRRQVLPRRSPGSGPPSGCSGAGRSAQHEAVATKIAFIAATTYGLESMLDLSCLLADDDRNDIRIEAALVKLYALARWPGRSPTS